MSYTRGHQLHQFSLICSCSCTFMPIRAIRGSILCPESFCASCAFLFTPFNSRVFNRAPFSYLPFKKFNKKCLVSQNISQPDRDKSGSTSGCHLLKTQLCHFVRDRKTEPGIGRFQRGDKDKSFHTCFICHLRQPAGSQEIGIYCLKRLPFGRSRMFPCIRMEEGLGLMFVKNMRYVVCIAEIRQNHFMR